MRNKEKPGNIVVALAGKFVTLEAEKHGHERMMKAGEQEVIKLRAEVVQRENLVEDERKEVRVEMDHLSNEVAIQAQLRREAEEKPEVLLTSDFQSTQYGESKVACTCSKGSGCGS